MSIIISEKDYLMKLLEDTGSIIGDYKNQIVAQIDSFPIEQIIHLIEVLEKALDRKKRIEMGNSEQVFNEIKTEQIFLKHQEQSSFLKKVHMDEESEKKNEKNFIDGLLEKIKNILNN